MSELHLQADQFQVGDIVHTDEGRSVEIRSIERRDGGELIVNPGAPDELEGMVWQTAKVTRNA
ncbi:hypothetical protein ABZX74_15585 [Streptomyces olivaceoviridis]|uniref:hypothetical protein n=1 Tax=Streptomyces olivaceoviridis TaxID=1921 RepID=UPI0033B31F45